MPVRCKNQIWHNQYKIKSKFYNVQTFAVNKCILNKIITLIMRANEAVITFSTKEVELGSWQSPIRKEPHFPVGVPKLANFTVEMLRFLGHWRWIVALLLLLSFPSSSAATRPQMLEILRRENLILVGSPPFSSKITRMFPDGLNQDRGTWYLINANRQINGCHNKNKDVSIFVFSILVYHLCVGSPEPVRHFCWLNVPL